MFRFVSTNLDGATEAITRGLDRALGGGLRVLWLLSGASNVAVELAVLKRLEHATSKLLTIGMIDERFVPADSPDSNWHQLLEGGLSDGRATLLPPIVGPAPDVEAAAADYGQRLARAVKRSDVIVGQFGIGTDGHIAGVFPGSAAVREEGRLAVGYDGPDFQRITTTPALFRQLHLAVAVVFGEAKHPVLERLGTDAPADELPAQLLRQARDTIIYTDQPVMADAEPKES